MKPQINLSIRKISKFTFVFTYHYLRIHLHPEIICFNKGKIQTSKHLESNFQVSFSISYPIICFQSLRNMFSTWWITCLYRKRIFISKHTDSDSIFLLEAITLKYFLYLKEIFSNKMDPRLKTVELKTARMKKTIS